MAFTTSIPNSHLAVGTHSNPSAPPPPPPDMIGGGEVNVEQLSGDLPSDSGACSASEGCEKMRVVFPRDRGV